MAIQAEDFRGNQIDSYVPIRLTEDWLIKLGLQNGIFTDNEYFRIEDGSIYFEDSYTCINVEYVHTLQNLYFLITGQELTIKNS